MKTVKIRLGGVEEIRAFVNAAAMYEYDIDLRGGRYVVDGKSIMGIFSLDLSAPIEMVVYGDKEDELIAKAENGIYITAVKGLHAGADATTGDFSIESEGFLIEGGKKTTYVRSFTIAGNFFELLKNIDSLSDTVEWGIPGGFTVFGAPAVLVRDMSVAGK